MDSQYSFMLSVHPVPDCFFGNSIEMLQVGSDPVLAN
jgi:hypothetical protein